MDRGLIATVQDAPEHRTFSPMPDHAAGLLAAQPTIAAHPERRCDSESCQVKDSTPDLPPCAGRLAGLLAA